MIGKTGPANRVVEKRNKWVVETQISKKTGFGIGEKLVAADKLVMEYEERQATVEGVVILLFRVLLGERSLLDMREIKYHLVSISDIT